MSLEKINHKFNGINGYSIKDIRRNNKFEKLRDTGDRYSLYGSALEGSSLRERLDFSIY